MASRPFAKLIGDKKLIRKLDTLKKSVRKRIEKKVIRAGATVVKKSIKSEVPVDEGHLKKSIDVKFPKRGGAVVGANAEYFEDGERPANYVHLVEYGYMTANGQTVPGSHPIERGSIAAQGAAGAKMTAKCKTELDKLL